jgi:hypothetical protein
VTYLELADVEDAHVGAHSKDGYKHRAIAPAGKECAVEMHLVGVVAVEVGDNVLILCGEAETHTLLKVLPGPLRTVLMLLQTFLYQRKALDLQPQLRRRKRIQDSKETSHTGGPTVDDLVLDQNLGESSLNAVEHAVARAPQHADIILVHQICNVEQEFDRKTEDALVIRY